jgi:teichuronic acid biosynthesis glycosyltransferase TuaC
MIRVLTLASLFPDATRPVFGPFVERQTLGIAAHPEIDLQVVAPIGLPPWPLTLHLQYRALAALPSQEHWKGLTVHRPRFIHLPATQGRFDAGMMARALTPLLRELRRDFPFDVIDAEYFFPDGPAAVQLGKTFDVPVSIKSRGSDIHFWGAQPATRPQVVAAGQGAAGLLAVSAALKRDMVALGLPEDRITVHYTGVDLERFKPKDRALAKLNLGISGALIVCVGGLIERKGQPLVIEALAGLPDATLVLIGHGPDRDKLVARAEQNGVADRVLFTGSLPQEEIAIWLAAADIMALPSASEGLANAWVEALACGTPIVIADVGGARELLDRPEAGRLVDQTAGAVEAGIAEILRNPPEQAAVRATAERFTWQRNTDALYAHFARITGK